MAGVIDLDQTKVLETALRKVKEQAFYMKHAMDNDDLKGTLTHASDMLRELRTGLLTPKNYYELYMKVLDELRYLEDYFTGLQKQGKPVVELYEKVQSCGNVLPRLYLLVTVAGVYIKSLEAPARDILKDLVEMAKGVQHPMRGLFLRNYLSQVSRDKLPDVGTPYNGEGGTVQDAYEFILQNFCEANRLWCRMQNQKDKKKREKERQELRILVGTNLVRLSQLQGVDVAEYKAQILPRILEQVVSCKDTIAQSYLMECIIQVFGDEFHIATLEEFLAACTQLKEKVNVRAILEGMMDRLAAFAESNPDSIPADLKTFDMFNACVTKLLEERPSYSLHEVLRLQSSLLNYALQSYPGNLDYVNHCLGQCAAVLAKRSEEHILQQAPLDAECVEVIARLLTLPLASLALKVLELQHFASLLEFLPWRHRKAVAVTLVRAVLAARAPLADMGSLQKLLGMLVPMIREEPVGVGIGEGEGGGEGEGAKEGKEPAEKEEGEGDGDGEEGLAPAATLEEEQLLLARLVHAVAAPGGDTDLQFRFLSLARQYLMEGGPDRIGYTLPPLVFATLRLVQRVRKREMGNDGPTAPSTSTTPSDTTTDGEAPTPAPAQQPQPQPPLQYGCRKIFQFVHEVLTALAPTNAGLALKLFLEAARAADRCEGAAFKLIAYEFVTQAFLLYEDELTDSKTQIRALTSMVGTLIQTRRFDESDYDALATKTTQYAAKLLKKPDQCRMVAMASHLFFVGKESDPLKYHDPKRVLECLQRSVKTADMCSLASSQHVHLFVEVLNHYLTFYEAGCPTVTEKYVSALIAFINDKRAEGDGPLPPEVEAYYRQTLDYIRLKSAASGSEGAAAELAEKFRAIQV